MAGIVNNHYMYCGQKAALNFTYTGMYNQREDGVVELLTSGTLVFLDPAVIDIFCVGGGGCGGSLQSTRTERGTAGGAGGYTKTVLQQNVKGSYGITIGAGGTSNTLNGGTTSFGTLASAAGGNGASQSGGSYDSRSGQNGGSGSGGGVDSNSDYGSGGSDGGNGERGYPDSITGGSGQGSTTREFGEPTGKLYAGGGGGGRYMVSTTPAVSPGGSGGGGAGAWVGVSANQMQAPSAGGANTGGGGGGGARYTTAINFDGASGGSGIVCFRAAK